MAASNQVKKDGDKQAAEFGCGFAVTDPGRQREITRKDGKAAHQSGKAYEFTADEACKADRKSAQTGSKQR